MPTPPVLSQRLLPWLTALGYTRQSSALHVRGADVPVTHPFASEIGVLLDPKRVIRAAAVFDVNRIPTVIFLTRGDDVPLSSNTLDAIRQRVWNQNLVRVIVDLHPDRATVYPTTRLPSSSQRLPLAEARTDGRFSAFEVSSGNLARRLPNWFAPPNRVDHELIRNLTTTAAQLAKRGFLPELPSVTRRQRAELLLQQIIFICYLEHRGVLGATYRKRRQTDLLHDLIEHRNASGLSHLIDCLRRDFNGDFLADDRHDPWTALTDVGYGLLHGFLGRTDMNTGQGHLWNYDFSLIPVELLSGLYESFIATRDQARNGAYYTPRQLALLTVEQAFASSTDPLSDTVFDCACGSGILLTTAYRRQVLLAEARQRRRLTFAERRDLLVRNIFGADIDLMACRVTAFSLYLSLLEGLDPADILEAQDRENVKLPPLAGRNLHHGTAADFFRSDHGFRTRRFSLLISNPPWVEPSAQATTTADDWAAASQVPYVRRQLAGAFVLRALDFLGDEGRLCMILPISQFLAPSSARFVSWLFDHLQPLTLVNFGDFQDLLFPNTAHTCHVFTGRLRVKATQPLIHFAETFRYCTPKADVSLSYGHPTIQSADVHDLQTRSVSEDPQLLVNFMWGDNHDLSIWTRFQTLGSLGDLWNARAGRPGWVCRKGVHFKDVHRDGVSVGRLRDLPYVDASVLRAGRPVLGPIGAPGMAGGPGDGRKSRRQAVPGFCGPTSAVSGRILQGGLLDTFCVLRQGCCL